MDIPKELWKEVLTEVEEEILRQLFGIPDVKLKGYRKGKAPRSAMIQQLLQPDNFRNVRYGLNFMGKKESFEIDYSNLPVEELMAAIEEKSNLYDVPMIVCHMFSSEDENVRLRGLDLWDRYKAKPNETAESEAVAPVPQPKEETAPPEGTMLKKLQKKYNDLKENREKDRKEWDKQRTNLHAENVQLKQELKQAKADLQRAEQEKENFGC